MTTNEHFVFVLPLFAAVLQQKGEGLQALAILHCDEWI
jgi:hypothetical protein